MRCGGRNRLVKNLICMAVVRRQYSMQRFLNNWSVLCTATEAHFGKGTKGDTALPTLPNPHYPSKIANTLATLVKGEVLSPEKIRAITGGIAAPPIATPPTLQKTALSRSLFVGERACSSRCIEPLYSHNNCKKTIIPQKSPSHLPPLSKGGGLTARHKH